MPLQQTIAPPAHLSRFRGIIPPRARRWGLIVITLLCILALTREVALDYYRVHGNSMTPTLRPGDYILADKMAFGKGLPLVGRLFSRDDTPSRSEMVIFALHPDKKIYLIKRIVGLPGDTLSMQAGTLYVNHQQLAESYTRHQIDPARDPGAPSSWHYSYLLPEVQIHQYAPTGADWGPILVPEGVYFVLGDNRNESGDSRRFGFVRHDELIAKPIVLLYSNTSNKAATWLR